MNKELLTDLLNERIKLAERLEGLSKYINCGILYEVEMDLALDQKKAMYTYLETLTQRIKHYEE
ncbi:hypothetical protein [uncultured Mediterranean phage uvMED]|nr:hypothetical protein [uncultured Mediterranean phage uvMED]